MNISNPISINKTGSTPDDLGGEFKFADTDFSLKHVNRVYHREEPGVEKVLRTFSSHHIRSEKRDTYVIVGFDTEYKVPSNAFSPAQVREGKAKYEILSYQFFAKSNDGKEWHGIILPDEGERLSFSEFMIAVIAKGLSEGHVESLPNHFYLVAHYNRADIPAFDDRDTLIKKLNNVRKSIVSYDLPIKITVNYENEPPRSEDDEELPHINVYVRDTILLAPGTSRSLAAIGELIGYEKIILSQDEKREQFLKENMDVLLREDWELFRQYALMDAEICLRYFEKLSIEYESLMGSNRLPSSLSSIGTKLLLDEWDPADNKIKSNRLKFVGKEEVRERIWNKQKQLFNTKKRDVYLEEIAWFIDFATECYHG